MTHQNCILGEEVAAYVKLTEEASSSSSISVDEVLEFAKTGLARFKVPKYLKFTGISKIISKIWIFNTLERH